MQSTAPTSPRRGSFSKLPSLKNLRRASFSKSKKSKSSPAKNEGKSPSDVKSTAEEWKHVEHLDAAAAIMDDAMKEFGLVNNAANELDVIAATHLHNELEAAATIDKIQDEVKEEREKQYAMERVQSAENLAKEAARQEAVRLREWQDSHDLTDKRKRLTLTVKAVLYLAILAVLFLVIWNLPAGEQAPPVAAAAPSRQVCFHKLCTTVPNKVLSLRLPTVHLPTELPKKLVAALRPKAPTSP